MLPTEETQEVQPTPVKRQGVMIRFAWVTCFSFTGSQDGVTSTTTAVSPRCLVVESDSGLGANRYALCAWLHFSIENHGLPRARAKVDRDYPCPFDYSSLDAQAGTLSEPDHIDFPRARGQKKSILCRLG